MIIRGKTIFEWGRFIFATGAIRLLIRPIKTFVEKTFVWGDAPFSIPTMLRVRFVICEKRIVASIRSIYSRHNRISCKYTFISYCDMIFLPVYPSWHVYFVDFNKKMADKRRMPKRSIAHLIRPYGSSAMDVLFSKSCIEKARVFFSIYWWTIILISL